MDVKILGGIFGAIVAAYVAIIGVVKWVSAHTGNIDRHPSRKDIVFNDVCVERGKSNKLEHKRLEDCIEGAIERSNEQHAELKQDMNRGFDKIEDLIKNGK